MSSVLALFSLWTYAVTQGKLMIVDLQGVHSAEYGFVLTDPAILCEDIAMFGNNNLGKRAIERCKSALESFLTHHKISF